MPSLKNKANRKLMIIILLDVLLIGLVIGAFYLFGFSKSLKIQGTYINKPFAIEEFNLTDHHGLAFSKNHLKGHWTLVFFGFTSCQAICPTIMVELNKMYKKLQQDLPQAWLPKVVFISVNPENDSTRKIKQFINSFNRDFIGVRGDITHVIALEKQFHLPVSKNPLDHSMEIVLLNPEVKVQAYFSFPHHFARMATDYQLILNKTNF